MFEPTETTNRLMDAENNSVIKDPKTPPMQPISLPRTPPGGKKWLIKLNNEEPMISGPISTKSFYDYSIYSCTDSTPSITRFTHVPTALLLVHLPPIQYHHNKLFPIPHLEREINVNGKTRKKN
ncbi:hypothetical protein QE152_g30845 [Popillia japonica]|uniref:Uncharacterized protein n=1 Tax=Popillia japonica TaxID=7064 RepID=A0AAW1JCW7_POPJA